MALVAQAANTFSDLVSFLLSRVLSKSTAMPSTQEQLHAHAAKHAGDTGIIHNTMKRAMDKICGADVAAMTEEQYKRFMTFIYAFALFLEDHHDNEEEIFFPAAVQKEPERLKPVVTKLEEEHKDFLEKIKRVLALATKPQETTREKVIEAQSVVQSFHETLVEHFDVEVRELTAEHYEKYYTIPEMKNQTARAAANAKRGDPTLGLAFVVIQMNREERAIIKGALPWIVRYFLVPMWMNKHAAVWKEFGAFPEVDARGRIAFVA